MTGIIMSAESVRAIQAGLKHETRRPIKPQPEASTVQLVDDGDRCWRKEPPPDLLNGQYLYARCPFQEGQSLWVRERWVVNKRHDAFPPPPRPVRVWYPAKDNIEHIRMGRTRSPMHMPRWASRFLLPLVEVRAERLWDITKEGALAEGVEATQFWLPPHDERDPIRAYAYWWDSLNAKTYPWSSNPWVWVLRWA